MVVQMKRKDGETNVSSRRETCRADLVTGVFFESAPTIESWHGVKLLIYTYIDPWGHLWRPTSLSLRHRLDFVKAQSDFETLAVERLGFEDVRSCSFL